MMFQGVCSAPEIILVSAVKASKYTVFIQDSKKLSCLCQFKYASCVPVAGLPCKKWSELGLSGPKAYCKYSLQDYAFFQLFETILLNSRTLSPCYKQLQKLFQLKGKKINCEVASSLSQGFLKYHS